MDMSVQKRFFSGSLALLAVGLGVICCMVFADTGLAAVPPTGLNCVASDGKISGRGATFQERAQQAVFAPAYRDDYCGNVAEQFAGDPAGNGMVTYNYDAAKKGSATGSGNGLKAASCRTDAFSGTDIPYTNASLKQLNEKAGATEGCGIGFEPPFQPKPSPWPEAKDTTAPVMSFPVAGSSVALVTNLTEKNCGTGIAPPTALNLNAKEVSRLLGGDVSNWNDPELVATNPGGSGVGLEKCAGAVTRVVRQDISGTTNIFKQYLIRAENERTGGTRTCAAGKKWEAYFTTNTEWPGKQGAEGTCSTITTGAKSGNGELLAKLKETEGGVGYADLNEASGSGLLLPSVENATKTSFQPPKAAGANCSFSSLSLPGLTAESSVGLNPEDTWANNNEENPGKPANHENATNVGAKYPICGLTFMLVYSGLDNGAVLDPINRLTADQRRTLYSYSTFILSSAGQDLLGNSNYAALPSAWVPKLRSGFQENF
jgi:ABC-type phosphate transport system substrate-binding protein